ncbi:MAG: LysM peptidoglycan-binding domain-containing protein [bacterium]
MPATGELAMKRMGNVVRMAIRLAVPVAAALAAAGCVAFETPEQQDLRMQQMASLNSDVQTLMNERQQMVQMLEQSRQENAQLGMKSKDLSDRLDLVEQRFGTLDGAYRRKLEDLQRTISSESAARKTAIDDVVHATSQSIATTANKLQAQQRQAVKAAVEGVPQGDYVVQKGDTLTAIARAFGITTASLSKANNLKGGTVRPGQKLVIPKK